MQQQSKQKTKIFSGTIVKNGDNFVLSDAANKLSYLLDDAEKASQFEGKKVKVTGTVDVASKTIHVESIQEIARANLILAALGGFILTSPSVRLGYTQEFRKTVPQNSLKQLGPLERRSISYTE